MGISKNLSSIMLFSITLITHAGNMGAATDDFKNVITLSGAPIWLTGLRTMQTLYFSAELSRTYTVNSASNVVGNGELFFGKQRTLNSNINGQLGIVLAAASQVKFSGNIWDFDDSRFNNYAYSYTTQPSRIAIGGKLIGGKEHLVKPWINASIGLSIIRAAHYKEVPLICEVEILPQTYLSNNTTKSFTYTVGAGIQKILSQHWQFGVGYEFTDWGKSKLTTAPSQPSHSKALEINHLYSNGLVLNLTWIG